DAMIGRVRNIEASVRARSQAPRIPELRLAGWTVVSAKASGSTAKPGPGQRGDDSIRTHLPNPVIEVIRDVKSAVGSHGQTARTPEFRFCRRPAVTAIAESRRVVPCHRMNNPVRSHLADMVVGISLSDVEAAIWTHGERVRRRQECLGGQNLFA